MGARDPDRQTGRPGDIAQESRWFRVTAKLVAVLALTACGLPGGPRDLTAGEHRAVSEALASWIEHGRDWPRCHDLADLQVYELPSNDLVTECAGETTLACESSPRVVSCVIRRGAPGPTGGLVYVDAALPEDHRERIVLHESLHLIRACWVEDAGADHQLLYERWWEGCWAEHAVIGGPWDSGHCDSDLWGPMQRAAKRRLLTWQESRGP